jgi:NAD(P)-dependent dehydrogenase (short-subunit alcohol dehydrogenase family)
MFNWKTSLPETAFISGGGSGIGREFALLLAAEGANVAIFNRRLMPEVIAELQARARGPAQRFVSYRADVSDEAGLRRAIDQAVSELGAPDLAINSAGIGIAKPFAQLSGEEFTQVINVNLIGSRNFAAAVLPHLRAGSHLVLVASLASIISNHSYAAYCASKFGTLGLAQVLRLELGLQGIDVTVCNPGEIDTPFVTEENKTLHPVARELKDFAGTLQVGPACRAMMADIAARRFESIPGFKPRLTAWLGRAFPGLMRRLADRMARAAARRHA